MTTRLQLYEAALTKLQKKNVAMGIDRLYEAALIEQLARIAQALENINTYTVPETRRPTRLRDCVNCGRSFETVNRSDQIYCDHFCRGKANARRTYWRKKERAVDPIACTQTA